MGEGSHQERKKGKHQGRITEQKRIEQNKQQKNNKLKKRLLFLSKEVCVLSSLTLHLVCSLSEMQKAGSRAIDVQFFGLFIYFGNQLSVEYRVGENRSHCVSCHFVLLNVSFALQKLVSFMRSQLLIVCLSACAIGALLCANAFEIISYFLFY